MEQPGHRVGLTPAVSANNSSPESFSGNYPPATSFANSNLFRISF
jgi:hypothetical protein